MPAPLLPARRHESAERHRCRRAAMAVVVSMLTVPLATMGASSVAGASSGTAHTRLAARRTVKLFGLLPAKIRSSDTIVDYVQPTYPPMEMTHKNGTGLEGVDVLLARAAAKLIGVKLHIVSVTTFAELFPALTSGRADMVWSGIFDTPTKYKVNTFADYFKTGTQLYIPASEKATFKHVSQLCGHTIAGETATFFQANLRASFKRLCTTGKGVSFIDLTGVAAQNLTMQEGRAQAAVDGPEIVDYLLRTTKGKYARIGPTFYSTFYGAVFENNSSGKQLEHVIALATDKLIANGTYMKVLKTYGLQRQAVKKVTIDKGVPQA